MPRQRNNNNQRSKNNRSKPKKSNQNLNQRMQQLSMSQPPPPKSNTFLGDIGQLVGNGVSKIFGLGAYQLSQNTVYQDMVQNTVPVMHSTSESVIFRHREYIGDVFSTTAFTTTTYNVNPGLSSTFPYLCSIAQNFQEYKFRGLVFEFKSTSADALNSTNTALGQVILAAQYRADASAFVNKEQMLNEMWSVSTKPSNNVLLPIECDPKENPFAIQYTRSGSVPSGQDEKLYDLCNLVIGTYGSQAAANVGELWATYEIELLKPQATSMLGLNTPSYHAYASSGVSTSAYFGSSATNTVAFDNIGITIDADGIIFPIGSVGKYWVCVTYSGSSATLVNPTIATDANCTASYNWLGAGTSYNVTSSGAGTKMILNTVIVKTDNTVTAQVSFSGATLPASITAFDLQIVRMNYSCV